MLLYMYAFASANILLRSEFSCFSFLSYWLFYCVNIDWCCVINICLCVVVFVSMEGQRWCMLAGMGKQKQRECCFWNAMLLSIFKTMLVNICDMIMSLCYCCYRVIFAVCCYDFYEIVLYYLIGWQNSRGLCTGNK